METREILFRGITASKPNKFVYGSLLQDYAGTSQIWEKDADGGSHNYIVIPETVGQFTGLLDKNGKMIFEWDKVQSTTIHNRQWIIEHRNDSEFIGFVPNEVGKVKNSLSTFVAWNTLETIGTIHDHLLKGE